MIPDPSPSPAPGLGPLAGPLSPPAVPGLLPEVFAALPGAFVLLTPELRIVAVSDAYLASVLTTREQLLGQYLPDAFPGEPGTPEGDTMTSLRASLQQVLATGQPQAMPVQPYRLRDPAAPGATLARFWEARNTPVRDGQGMVNGIIHSVVDITERVQLREQQSLLSQILGQVPAAVATLGGPEHRFSFFNTHYLALTDGRARLGATVAELLPEVVEQGFINLLDRVYTTGEPFLGNELSILLHPAGTSQPIHRHLDFVYQPLTDGQGRTLGILVFAVDVTDKVLARRQAETLLAAVQHQKEERENVFQLFEQSPAVICLLREPEHRIDYLNPAYQALFPGQPLRGRTLAEVQPEATALVALLDGIYQTGAARFQPEVPITITPLGALPPRTRYFDFTYQAYREQERIAGVSIFGLDVTEQVLARRKVQELNQELQARNQQLTRTNADLDTFVYTASHDLKVPISNIEGLLDALSRDLRSQDTGGSVPRILRMMHEAVTRFQQTIGHLTDISRLQQEGNVPGEAGSLATTIADVQLDLAPLLATTGAQVAVELADAPTLPLSPKNLRSVVYNLLSNALKYRAPDRVPVVRIQSQQQGDTVVLRVHDNGLGLDERQQLRLFKLFQRLHAHVEGSGVGLYMVRKIVENAGGTVQVQSQVEVGTTFTVTLPQRREHPAA